MKDGVSTMVIGFDGGNYTGKSTVVELVKVFIEQKYTGAKVVVLKPTISPDEMRRLRLIGYGSIDVLRDSFTIGDIVNIANHYLRELSIAANTIKNTIDNMNSLPVEKRENLIFLVDRTYLATFAYSMATLRVMSEPMNYISHVGILKSILVSAIYQYRYSNNDALSLPYFYKVFRLKNSPESKLRLKKESNRNKEYGDIVYEEEGFLTVIEEEFDNCLKDESISDLLDVKNIDMDNTTIEETIFEVMDYILENNIIKERKEPSPQREVIEEFDKNIENSNKEIEPQFKITLASNDSKIEVVTSETYDIYNGVTNDIVIEADNPYDMDMLRVNIRKFVNKNSDELQNLAELKVTEDQLKYPGMHFVSFAGTENNEYYVSVNYGEKVVSFFILKTLNNVETQNEQETNDQETNDDDKYSLELVSVITENDNDEIVKQNDVVDIDINNIGKVILYLKNGYKFEDVKNRFRVIGEYNNKDIHPRFLRTVNDDTVAVYTVKAKGFGKHEIFIQEDVDGVVHVSKFVFNYVKMNKENKNGNTKQ